MSRDEANGLPNPGQVSTAEDLAAALKQLMRHSKLDGRAVAQRSGLAESTISAAINGKKFPRSDSLREIVKAGCNQDPKPWLDAWERAKKDKHKVSVEEIAELVESMESRIDSLETALRDALTRIDSLESEKAHLRAAGAAAGLEEERQARTDGATDVVMNTLRALRRLGLSPQQAWKRDTTAGIERGPEPEWHHSEVVAWTSERSALIDALHFASEDIVDNDLRLRLSEAIQMMEFCGGPEKHAGQPESATRYIAVTGALAATGAYRRGQDLPERTSDYLNTLEFAHIYQDELEANY